MNDNISVSLINTEVNIMWKLAQYQINQAINDHMRWLESGGKMGHRLCIVGHDLTNLDLSNANMQYSFFEDCRLNNANLTNSNLSNAILHTCDMGGARIRKTIFENTEFHKTDIRKAIGLMSTTTAMDKFFGNDGSGYIVYKVFGLRYEPDPTWIIKPGSIIEDPLYDQSRINSCGRGINCANMQYLRSVLSDYARIWKCRIPNEWIRGEMVCVPYNSAGNIRCRRLELICSFPYKEGDVNYVD